MFNAKWFVKSLKKTISINLMKMYTYFMRNGLYSTSLSLPTIGKELKHVEDAILEDVKNFYATYYQPNNAILTIAGNIEQEKAKELVLQYFGKLKSHAVESKIFFEPEL